MVSQNNRRWIRTVNVCVPAAMVLGPLFGPWAGPASAASWKDAQAAFDRKQYQEALDLIEQVTK